MKRHFAAAAMFFAVMIMVGCGTNPVTGESELHLVSYAQAGEAGANAAPEVEAEFGGVLNDAQLQAYVSKVGMRLVDQLPSDLSQQMDGYTPQWQFKVLNSEIINAFALPNGYIYLTRGILLLMRDEAEMAAVLGHEITHVAAGHTRKQLQQAVGLQLVIEAAGAGGGQGAGAAAQVAAALMQLKYSREDELQSDKFGMEWMTRAGYNPWGMVDLQQGLMDASGGGGGSDFMSTHPATEKRITQAKDLIAEKYAGYREADKDQNQATYRGYTSGLN